MPVHLDKTDRSILEALQRDSSISNRDLSRRVGLSPSACLSRTKNLIESGVITGFTTLVDEKKLGMEVTAFVLINLAPLNRDTIAAFLGDIRKYSQVQECYSLTGSHDFLLKIVARNMADYRNFLIDSLMKSSTVSSAETSVVMGVEKHTTYVPVEEERP